ncbi:MAG: hypothetical protein ABSB30_07790 [Terracidiphilus sp.]|jgi:hypothetical protein
MTEATQTAPAPSAAEEPSINTENPAVVRCVSAWAAAYKEAKAQNKDNYDASKEATQAYRNAMPSLSGFENTRDFIACVARGILLGVIDGKIGAKLLYAAQVALSAVPRQPAPRKTTAAT